MLTIRYTQDRPSNRDDRDAEQNRVRGKAFDNSAPIGPVVATPDEVPEEPRVQPWLNGEQRQDSAEDELVFSPSRAISDVSKFLTLEPGDIVAMGTTVGVGPLSDGDRIEIEVEGVGRLEHSVESQSVFSPSTSYNPFGTSEGAGTSFLAYGVV